jgi:ribulose-5-phosphate 4-epimerase/fuculose-1-phosphate aldolase
MAQIQLVDSIRDRVSDAEWQMRVDLAAAYRLVAHFGWDDLIFTHISARVPDAPDQFLINPYGMMFDEITASSLVKVDHEGQPVLETPYDVNPAGFIIHSAVHEARPEVGCVMHTHTSHGVAVSAQQAGLLPISQQSMFALTGLAYHDYEGVALREDEKARLVADLGRCKQMILRNHGLLTCGQTVAHAFNLMRNLEKCCKAQIAAMSTGAQLIRLSPNLMEYAAGQVERRLDGEAKGWQSLLKKLDKIDPSYRD